MLRWLAIEMRYILITTVSIYVDLYNKQIMLINQVLVTCRDSNFVV